MIEAAKKYKEVLGYDDWWNNESRVDYLWRLFQELDLKDKKVLDLGSRYGLYSYLALQAGASYVVGVDIDHWAVEESERVFESLEVEDDLYCFSNYGLSGINFEPYDVILALGIFYNIPNHEYYLSACHNADKVLVEFWLDNNDEEYPVLRWLTDIKVEDHGPAAGEVVYQQYLPNVKYAETMFDRCGFAYKQLQEAQPGHCNVFFLLEPTHSMFCTNRQWGTRGVTTVKFL